MIITPKNIKSYQNKCDQIILIVIFIVLILLCFCLFAFWNPLNIDTQTRTTVIVSSIGLVFVVFQFLMNNIFKRNERIYNIRYLTYKEIVKVNDEFSTCIVRVIPIGKVADIDILYETILIAKHNAISCFKNDYEYIFPDLGNCLECSDLVNNIGDVFIAVSRLRDKLYNSPSNMKVLQKQFYEENKNLMSSLYTSKAEFYKKIRENI